MTIEQDVSEAISKNLPAAVGEELRKRLEKAAKDQDQVRHLTHEHAKLEQELRQHTRLEAREKAVKDREAEAAAREAKVSVRETNISHKEEIATLREANCKERIGDLKEVVSTVFRSPVFTRSISTSEFENRFVPNGPQGYVNGQTVSENKSTTVTEKIEPTG